jgi:threonine dehydratase
MLINFFRKTGALKEFLSEILNEDDDVLRVEYTRKNNREKGPALVGI